MQSQTLESVKSSDEVPAIRGKATGFLRSPANLVALSILLVYLGLAVAGLLLPDRLALQPDGNHVLSGPSLAHLLGTDQIGRDQLARLIFGATTSLLIVVPATVIALVVGATLGLVAGYVRGSSDVAIMRVIDVFFAFPPVLLALAIVAGLGPGSLQLVVAIGIVYMPMYVRVVRGPTLQLRVRSFVEASLLMGAKRKRIISRHIVPNLAPDLLIHTTLTLAWALLTAASLSFLGLGVQPPQADWGAMLSEGKDFLVLDPWLAVVPGIMIVLIVTALNLLGDGLREATDPRLHS